MTELESLFSASDPEQTGKLRLNVKEKKPEKVQLVHYV